MVLFTWGKTMSDRVFQLQLSSLTNPMYILAASCLCEKQNLLSCPVGLLNRRAAPLMVKGTLHAACSPISLDEWQCASLQSELLCQCSPSPLTLQNQQSPEPRMLGSIIISLLLTTCSPDWGDVAVLWRVYSVLGRTLHTGTLWFICGLRRKS